MFLVISSKAFSGIMSRKHNSFNVLSISLCNQNSDSLNNAKDELMTHADDWQYSVQPVVSIEALQTELDGKAALWRWASYWGPPPDTSE